MGLMKALKGGLTGGVLGAARASGVGMKDILGAISPAYGMATKRGIGRILKEDEEEDRARARGGQPMPVLRKKGGKISAAEAVHKHERKMHKGKPLTKLAKGGSTASKRADGCATKGKTKGRMV